FLCDPTQVTGAAGAEVCASGGTNLGGNPRTLVADASSSPPTSSVLSSPGVVANKSGVWCFRAVYTPTGTTYTGSSDATHGECVTVGKVATTTVTTPSDSSGTALSSPVAFGTTLFDKAVVTGTDLGGNPPAQVAFFPCDPRRVTGACGAEVCASGGTNLGVFLRTRVPPGASLFPYTTLFRSPGVVANKSGVWCFRAVYTPTGTTYTGS